MAVKMVREPSETPNISNVDDFVGLRYAYGNQNGYVINKLNECSYEIIGNTFKINSGRLVLQGIETDIDANGFLILVDNIATKRFYSVYLEVNLENMSSSIKSSYDTAGYPIIEEGDDLTKVTNGIAKMILYTFDATSGIITNVKKRVNAIAYSGTALVGYDISKGTVEERLTRLGFRQGSLILPANIQATENILTRQGNYVIGKLTIEFSGLNTMKAFDLPEGFKIKKNTKLTISAFSDNNSSTYGNDRSLGVEISNNYGLSGDNEFYIIAWNLGTYRDLVSYLSFNFGYEAEPIN